MTNFVHTGMASKDGDGLPEWTPWMASDKHTMFFQSTVPYGAKLDPCAMLTACYAEPTADYRGAMTTFWTTGFQTKPTLPTCDAVEISYSHTATAQYANNCVKTFANSGMLVKKGDSCSTADTCDAGLTCKCMTS